MIKMMARAIALPAVVFALGGCAEVKALFDNGPTVQEVQALSVKTCSFLPTADTVLKIISVGSPGLGTGVAIVNAICAAVAPKAGVSAGKAAVAGVPIEGIRVN